ncbi:class I SAM-dependent methyltransferase [Nocardioides sp.]|uniref:class I SAM-dependent methyltransferase n=1 Tax=Nocardioides sp. TaxID=35761 RepID=UPI002ED5F1D9
MTATVDRASYTEALEPARLAAFPLGEYVGQESFMTASEIRALARRAGIGQDDRVLDLCCGVAGPGRLVTQETRCRYLGVDHDPGAVAAARQAAGDLPCRFEVRRVPSLPDDTFDVVMLLETLLAFRDKRPLLAAVAERLPRGGRFAVTVEEGEPLTAHERGAMPAADTVWPVPLPELVDELERQGLSVASVEEHSEAHRATAAALADSFDGDRAAIGARIGHRDVDDLIASHRLWVDWLAAGRVRKLSLVAVR